MHGRREQERRPARGVDALACAARDLLDQAHVGVDRQMVAVILERRRRDHDDDVVARGELGELRPGVLLVAEVGHHAMLAGGSASVPGYQHAAVWPAAPLGRSPTSSAEQRSRARGQRGWKRQPPGMREASGTSPCSIAEPSAAGRGRVLGATAIERLRVRVLWPLEHVRGAAELDDAPEVHHRDAVAERPGHADVVRDQQQRQPAGAPQGEQQVQHLCAHGDVERRDRLVAHEPAGSGASAHAIATRWRCPPESSCG